MGKKKATRKAAAPSGKAGKAKARTPRGGSGAGPTADDELLAQLLELQERTAMVGRQLRAVGELVSTIMRETATVAAEVIEELGSAADAPAEEPPPVAARPRRPRREGAATRR
jgi:hypothetical protein